ncbi:aldehyde dehydrogenase family protein [Helcobacillus massiliensis]|uniref:aldehyde dehydrogenase family protein n=1 Tax=Helcobacillus massiliensis TaxID=521392 RepID=UPI0025534A65|nr:aldehyde dehydrogenase family protein [Helcobacillus massiliensis]MDK7742424.1 aldehyde dehydrogenase family protein [Helcobacillus massiliensis]WOO92489.1 aldehyde dehydrogenase family protein [Helcobacillus massiliensis]
MALTPTSHDHRTTADGAPASLFIAGQWLPAASGATRDITCPADGRHVLTVSEADPADTEKAIAAARRTFDDTDWQFVPFQEKAQILNRLADLLERDRREVARMEAEDTGKRYVESLGDMDDIVGVFRHFAQIAGQESGRTIDTGDPTISSRTVTEAVGVCALITPWNFPLLQTAWKIAPAIAAGNTFVLKPAELTPQSAMWLMDALKEAGLPDGVGNLITGRGAHAGAPLSTHEDIDLVSFTGGVETGRLLMANAATTVKKVALELGGKNPNIIFADADLDAAIDNALTAIFLDSGQVCSAGSRLIVEESVHDQVVEELVRRTKNIQLGGIYDENAETGALISEEHLQKVAAFVDSAVAEGATLLVGGQRATGTQGSTDLAKGCFYLPTALDDCTTEMAAVQEESFGPIVTIETFTGDSDEEKEKAALRIANDTIYGLAGAVWTKNAGRAERVAKRLRHGTVWINDFHPYVPQAEWGGFKQSGFGRELGRVGLEEYQEIKHIWHNTSPARANWFADGDTPSVMPNTSC